MHSNLLPYNTSMNNKWLLTPLFIGLLALEARAAVLTQSASAPADPNIQISQSDFSVSGQGNLAGGNDFTDNYGAPGQTFTPLSSFNLTTVTVKGGGDSGGLQSGAVFTITISQVTGGTTLTDLSQETAFLVIPNEDDLPPNRSNNTDYLTFTLDTAVPLVSGTQYAFSIYTDTGWYGLAKSSTDVYAGGAAIQQGSAQRSVSSGDAITNIQGDDRTFFITGVPEPGTVALLGLGLGVSLIFRRRRV